ncbi:MAG: endopeptidase La [Chloroflexota bacterium]
MSPSESVHEQAVTAAPADAIEDTQTINDIPTELDDVSVLPVIPLRDTVVFPNMAVPLRIGRPQSLGALEAALAKDRQVLLVAESTTQEASVKSEALFRVGTVAHVGQTWRMPEGDLQAVLHGTARAKVIEFTQDEPFLQARVKPVSEAAEKTIEVEALMRTVLNQFEAYVTLSKALPQEAIPAARNVNDPGRLADAIAFTPDLTFEQRQELLELFDPTERLRKVALWLGKQVELLEIGSRIQSEVQKGVEKSQRDYYLREQLKAIQRELGEGDPETAVAVQLRDKIEEIGMPDDIKERALREVDRLAQVPSASPETAVIRNYVDWLVALPWAKATEDHIDLKEAARILDEDHYGLKKVKERILEYMAVRKLAGEKMRSPILCFVGPPGVGKTSLGRSVARSLGRKFVRMSLGGVRDEAEIRGHRRTYVGALPGRIIQGIRNAGTRNPVFMLDEIDKVGADFRGDPSAALLEVLDPEQNNSFSDHYLEVPFDLSSVMFITTANMLDTVPPALRDRMEVIAIPGYTEDEKVRIARGYLVPRQLEHHGLLPPQLTISDRALRTIVRDYTKEAGVRNLEREIASICRKVAKQVAEGSVKSKAVRQSDVSEYLGPGRFSFGTAEEHDEVGVATGVAWTPFGGDILSIEVTTMEGQPDLILTGQLGDVMRESVRAALSYARSRSVELGIPAGFFEKHAIHVHVPAGAVPKDGPSAGITMATALVSALTGQAVRRDVAMTGEITLRGRVLPIGGLKEKMLAAQAAGIKTFILPSKNRKDLAEVPAQVKKGMEIVPVDHVSEVLKIALVNRVEGIRAA